MSAAVPVEPNDQQPLWSLPITFTGYASAVREHPHSKAASLVSLNIFCGRDPDFLSRKVSEEADDVFVAAFEVSEFPCVDRQSISRLDCPFDFELTGDVNTDRTLYLYLAIRRGWEQMCFGQFSVSPLSVVVADVFETRRRRWWGVGSRLDLHMDLSRCLFLMQMYAFGVTLPDLDAAAAQAFADLRCPPSASVATAAGGAGCGHLFEGLVHNYLWEDFFSHCDGGFGGLSFKSWHRAPFAVTVVPGIAPRSAALAGASALAWPVFSREGACAHPPPPARAFGSVSVGSHDDDDTHMWEYLQHGPGDFPTPQCDDGVDPDPAEAMTDDFPPWESGRSVSPPVELFPEDALGANLAPPVEPSPLPEAAVVRMDRDLCCDVERGSVVVEAHEADISAMVMSLVFHRRAVHGWDTPHDGADTPTP